MAKLDEGYPKDVKGIWKDRELYKEFRSFWVRTAPKAVIDFDRKCGFQSGDKINGRNSYELLELTGLHNGKNKLKLPPNDVKKITGKFPKDGYQMISTKNMITIVKDIQKLSSLRSKTLCIPPFYKSAEFAAYAKANRNRG